MKRVLLLLLTVCLLAPLSLSGCKKGDPAALGADETVLTLAADNHTDYRVVYTGGATNRSVANNFADALRTLTGATFEVVADTEAPAADGREIVIGDADRAVSRAAKEKVTSNLDFIIHTEGRSVAVFAASKTILQKGLDFFASRTVTEAGATFKRGTLTLPVGFSYLKETFSVTSSDHLAVICDVSTMSGHNDLEGVCTDGTYAYISYVNWYGNYAILGDGHDFTTIIIKYDMTNLKEVARSAPLDLGHANDMCYYPETGELLVVRNGKTVNRVDPETLTLLGEFEISRSINALTYNEKTDTFIAASGDNLFFYNTDFDEIRAVTGEATNNVKQSVDCDGEYVYMLDTGADTKYGILLLYTASGVYVDTARIPLPAGETEEIETEDILHIGDRWFVFYNAKGIPASNDYGHLHEIFFSGI